MDVPARQAYVVAVVQPDERTAAAAYTNSARYAARPVAPIIAGALVQASTLAAPFVVAGTLKSVYDLAFYRMFRRVPLTDEPTERTMSTRCAAGQSRPDWEPDRRARDTLSDDRSSPHARPPPR